MFRPTSVPEPHVRFREPAGDVRGVALVLHGGKPRSTGRPRRSQLAVARMLPYAARLAHDGHDAGIAAGMVLFRYRGWNGSDASPVADTRQILSEVRDRYGDAPVVLVGHSMGGRTALRCADDPSVVGVVALAPWLAGDDDARPVTGKSVLVLHGDRDRWTDPRASLAFTLAAQGIATHAARIEIRGDGHTMLRRARTWHALTSQFVLRTLGTAPSQSDGGSAANALLDSVAAGKVELSI